MHNRGKASEAYAPSSISSLVVRVQGVGFRARGLGWMAVPKSSAHVEEEPVNTSSPIVGLAQGWTLQAQFYSKRHVLYSSVVPLKCGTTDSA